MPYFLANKIFLVLIDFLALGLVYWVYSVNPKRVNKLFCIATLMMLFWWNGGYFFSFSGNLEVSLILGKIILAEVPFSFAILFIFLEYFPYENRIKNLERFILFFTIILSFLSLFSDLIVSGVKSTEWGITPVFGKLQLVHYGWLGFLMILIIYEAIKKYLSSPKEEKRKIQYFLLGFIILVVMNLLFNVIFPLRDKDIRYWQLGNYSAILFLSFTAYAIVKQKLFDIKIVLTTLLVGFISILLAIDILFFTESQILQFFKVISLLVFLYMGRQLIKSVLVEQERAEKMEILTKKLEQANVYLKELIDMKTDFLHIVSHQLRTPLTAIRGFISMWEDGDFDSYSPRKMKDVRKRIVSNVDRLNNLVNDMVVAMESEGGDMKMDFQSVDVEALIKSNIDMMKPTYEKRGLYLRYKKENKRLPKIVADGKYLSQVFMNLTDNAEKYTKKGGLNIKIERDKNNLKVLFIDTGIGVGARDKARLFKKFSRGVDSNRINPNGSGLGLFIIKRVIEKHHGKIEFESEGEGKGTTFTVTVPIVQPR